MIIKIGGSVISDKNVDYSFREDTIRRLAREIKEIEDDLILVHGGGSFGHPIARKFKIREKFSREGFAKIHCGMRKLNFMISRCFIEEGVHVVGVSPSSLVILKKGKVHRISIETIRNMIELGIVPLLHGDVVLDSEKGADILSGDQIVSFLAKEFGMDVIFLTDVDGIYTKDPKKYDDAKLIRELDGKFLDKIKLEESYLNSKDVTGGMKKKLEEIQKIVKYSNVIVANGMRQNVIKLVLEGKGPYTTIERKVYGKERHGKKKT